MPKRVLIADDDADLRRAIRRFLQSRTTCEVCGEAVNGAEAITKAGTLNPDLIVLDYSMPVMNGIEAGTVIKAMLPDVPVILFTSEDTWEIQSASSRRGDRDRADGSARNERRKRTRSSIDGLEPSACRLFRSP